MDNTELILTALSGIEPVNSANSLTEIPLNGKINLRGNPDDPAFLKAVETTLKLALPKANTIACNGGISLFWLGPDEWLIHLPLGHVEKTIDALSRAFEGMRHALTEVSDYYSVIELGGPQAREIIRSGSPFDVRAENFQPGQCAQTHFGHSSILLWPIDDRPSYGMQIRWSFAQYLYEHLADSIRNAEAIQSAVL